MESKSGGHVIIHSGSEFLTPEGKHSAGVVRLAGSAMKLEPQEGMPHHVDTVIKSVPKQPTLHMQMSPKMEEHHILTSQSPMTVLQDLHNMRPQFPSYADPYSGVPTTYARVDPAIGYAPHLAGLGPHGQSPFLPGGPSMSGYANILPDQGMYYRPGDPYAAYPGAVRPLQQVYQTESTEELLER